MSSPRDTTTSLWEENTNDELAMMNKDMLKPDFEGESVVDIAGDDTGEKVFDDDGDDVLAAAFAAFAKK